MSLAILGGARKFGGMMRCLALLLCFASAVRADPVVVFAAASLKAPLDEILEGQDVALSYGGSGAMAQQIARGAPADIFISANVDWMDWLAAQGSDVTMRVDLLGNQIVAVSRDPIGEGGLIDVLQSGPFAIGQVDSVPAGIYGRQALEHAGIWRDVEANAVQVPSVSAATRLVRLGHVTAGIVYYSEAVAADLNLLVVFPPHVHDPIIYPAGIIGAPTEDAVAVWDLLLGSDAQAVFVQHGFMPLASPDD